jgi:hypothetical protein
MASQFDRANNNQDPTLVRENEPDLGSINRIDTLADIYNDPFQFYGRREASRQKNLSSEDLLYKTNCFMMQDRMLDQQQLNLTEVKQFSLRKMKSN